jgi:hypothetical protein
MLAALAFFVPPNLDYLAGERWLIATAIVALRSANAGAV